MIITAQLRTKEPSTVSISVHIGNHNYEF